jgi:biopolymer transport protein ExbD
MRRSFTDDEMPDLPMTSLIDIVFLLLIFFLVATNFVKKEIDQQIKLPQTGDAASSKEALQAFVVNVRSDGGLVVNGRLTQESALKALAQEWVKKRGALSEKALAELRGDGRVPYETMMRVMAICKESGLEEVNLPVLAEK